MFDTAAESKNMSLTIQPISRLSPTTLQRPFPLLKMHLFLRGKKMCDGARNKNQGNNNRRTLDKAKWS